MVTIQLDEDIVEIMGPSNGSLDRLARELIVLELNREGMISKGKAAELLGMRLLDSIRFSGRRGIPYIDMTKEEWEEERARIDEWAAKR